MKWGVGSIPVKDIRVAICSVCCVSHIDMLGARWLCECFRLSNFPGVGVEKGGLVEAVRRLYPYTIHL